MDYRRNWIERYTQYQVCVKKYVPALRRNVEKDGVTKTLGDGTSLGGLYRLTEDDYDDDDDDNKSHLI
jgi:hypothetical protein